MAIKKYRKKPVVIEAMIWTGDNYDELEKFCGETNINVVDTFFHQKLYIMTLEGAMEALVGDYIIKGIQGEFYPCKPDIFNETYEVVEDVD